MVVLRHLHNVDGVVARERVILAAGDLQVTRIDVVVSSSALSSIATFVASVIDGVSNDDLLWLAQHFAGIFFDKYAQ